MAFPSTSYFIEPSPKGFSVISETWEIDRRGDKDCRTDPISHHPTREAAEAARLLIWANAA